MTYYTYADLEPIWGLFNKTSKQKISEGIKVLKNAGMHKKTEDIKRLQVIRIEKIFWQSPVDEQVGFLWKKYEANETEPKRNQIQI